MEYFSTEIFGTLYQVGIELTETENGLRFSSLFYLDKYIPINSCIDLVINNEIRPTFLQFHWEVGMYKLYSVSTHLLLNEYIKNSILSIKNTDGLEVGSWKIYEDIIDNYDVTAQSSPLSEALTSPTTSPNPNTNTLSCINCGVKETPLWRIKRMKRYCNACSLYLKRNGIHRKLDGDKVLRKKRKRKSRFCAECNTNSSPIWRNIGGKTYCNRHGLARRKRLFSTYQ